MAAAGYSNQQDSDLTFTANLQDNVSDVADQIQKKLESLGATKAQIKLTIQAVDQATEQSKKVAQHLKTIPKDVHVKIQAHADEAHKEIARIRDIAKKPIEIPLKIAHKLDDELHAAHEKIRMFKSNVAQTLMGMPLIGAMGNTWQQTGAPMVGAAASGLGVAGMGGMAAGGIGAAGAAAGGMALMQKSFDVNNQLQQSILELTAVTKDQAQASRDMQRLSAYNVKTPFPVQDTRQAFTTLRSMGISSTSPVGIKQVGDAAAATGRSQNDVALAAAAALRGDMSRLGGLGIPISTQAQLAARFPGQSPEKAISSLFNQQFGGAAATQSQSMQGIMTRIQDTIQQKLIGPGGIGAFSGVQGLAGGVATKLTSTGFQKDAGMVVQHVQEGIAHLWQEVQKGVEYFKVNLEEPLKRVMTSVVEIGKTFSNTFGGVILTGVKTLGEAFSSIIQPLSKFVSAHPLLVQMFAVMKAFQMLGMNKMASPFENFFKSINPLTFSVTGLIKSIGQLVMLAPKLAVLFTIKNMLDMHSATQALTDSFKKFGEDGGTAIDKLQTKLDLLSGTFGKSAAGMKQFAAQVSNVAPGSVGVHDRANFALRGAENMAIMGQQGFGGQANQLFLNQLKLDKNFTSGGADRAFGEVTQSIRGVSKALDVDLKTATKKTADALTMFSQELTKIGGLAAGAQGAGLGATLQGSIHGPVTKGAIDASLTNPAAIVRQMFHIRSQPDPDFLKALGPQNVGQAFSFGGGIPTKDIKQLEGYRKDFSNYTKFIGDYQKLSKSVGLQAGDIIQPQSSFARFFGTGIGKSDINTPEKLAAQYTRSAKTVQDVERAYSAAQQKSSQFQLQQEELGELQARVNQKFEIFQHGLVKMRRGIEDSQLAMNQYAFSALRPLQREMERLQNTTEVYQHKAIVPVQRAQEDWNHTMQQTQRRVEDVSFAVGKAQFNMDKWTEGLLTGEQAVQDNLHSLDLYNKQLQLLQLQNMSMQSQLTRTTVGEGYKEVVSPMMGFSLQRQIDINQRRQQIAQGESDVTYGEKHYQLTKAARGVRERTEIPFGDRMAGVKANLPVIDKALQQNRDLQDIQYKQSLHMRTLEDRMYRATVGARKFEDAQFALSQRMFSVNQNLEDMQDNLTGQQLALEKAQMGGRKYEDQLWKIQKPLTAVNIEMMKIEKQTQALDNVRNKARQIQGTLGDAMNATITDPRNAKEFGDQMIRIAGIMEKQGLMSEGDYKNVVKRVHKWEDEAGKSANRHVSIWKRAWDEISGDFVGIFTGQTWIKIYDTVKHGIESVFGHGAIGKILGNIGGVGAAATAGVYGINAALVGGQRGLARLTDHLPVVGKNGALVRAARRAGPALEGLAGEMTGEGGWEDHLRYGVGRAGHAIGKFEGIGDWLRAGAAKETILRPWLRFGGTAIDAGATALGSMVGHPGLGLMAGKGYSSAYEHRMVPGPITAARRFFGRGGGRGVPGAELKTNVGGGAGADIEEAAATVGRLGKFGRGAGKALGAVGVGIAGISEASDIAGIVQHPGAKSVGSFVSNTLGSAPFIGGIAQPLGAALQGKGIGEIITKIFTGSLGALGPLLVGGVKKAVHFLGGKVSDIASSIGDFFGKVFGHPEKIGRFIGKTLIGGLKLGIKAMAFIGITFPLTVIEKLVNLGAGALKLFTKLGIKIIGWIGHAIVNAAGDLWHFFTDLIHKAVMKFTDGGRDKNIFHMAGRIISWLVSGLWDGMGKVLDWIISLPGWMLDKVATIAGGIAKFGAKIAEGIWGGLKEGLKDFGNWLSGAILSAIPDPVKDFLGIANKKFKGTGSTQSPELQAYFKAHPEARGKPSHAGGLDRVPYDDYVAKLHKDETVLTAAEAHAYRQKKVVAHRATSITPVDSADMSKKNKGLRDWETRVKEHHIKLTTDDDRHKKNRDDVDDYWTKLRILRRDDLIKTTQNKFADHYKWSLDTQKQNLLDTQTQQDSGWSKISSITGGWISKVEHEIRKIDTDLGITIDKKGNVHAPAAKAHGGVVDGKNIGKGHQITVGEEGYPEVIVPLAPHRRDRAVNLLRQAEAHIGLSAKAAGHKFAAGGITNNRRQRGGVGDGMYDYSPAYATGGFAPGGFQGGPPHNRIVGLDGARISAAIRDTVSGYIHRFHDHITAAYDPGGGHVSPGHNVYGTATDIIPGAGGSWDMLESGLVAALKLGYTVLYDGRKGTTAYPNHGRGNHAHIEWWPPPSGAGKTPWGSFATTGGGGSFTIPPKLKKLLTHPPFQALLKHGVAGRRIARALVGKHSAWQTRIQKLGDAHAGADGGSGQHVQGSSRVARAIYEVWKQMGLPSQYLLSAFETGIVESGMTNPAGGDGTSVGWRQETASSYPHVDRMDVTGGAHRFFNEEKGMHWGGSAGQMAQAVQRSAFPYRYDQRRGEAISWMKRFGVDTSHLQGFAHGGFASAATAARRPKHQDIIKWAHSVYGNLHLPGSFPYVHYENYLGGPQVLASTNAGLIGSRDISISPYMRRHGAEDRNMRFAMVHELAHAFQKDNIWNTPLREGGADAFAEKFAGSLGYKNAYENYPIESYQARKKGRNWILRGQFGQSEVPMNSGGKVPYDNFPALLHTGEKVHTAGQVKTIEHALAQIEAYIKAQMHSEHPNVGILNKIIKDLSKHITGNSKVLHDIHRTLVDTKNLQTIATMDQKVRGSGRGSTAGVAASIHALHADQGAPGSIGFAEGGAGTSALIQREEATPHARELKKHWAKLGIATSSSELTVANIRKKLATAAGKKKGKLHNKLLKQLKHEHDHLIALRKSWNKDMDNYIKEGMARGTGLDVLHKVEGDITGDTTIHSDVQDPALTALGDPQKALKTAAKAVSRLHWSKLPRHAKGVDHVKRSHIAKIHKGEAVLTRAHATKLRRIARKVGKGGLSNLGSLIDFMHKNAMAPSGGIWGTGGAASFGGISHGSSILPSGIGLDHLLGVDPGALDHHTYNALTANDQLQDGATGLMSYYGTTNLGGIKSADPHSKLHVSNLSKLRRMLKTHKAHFAEGGVAARDGLAMLHKSEVVIPPGAKSGDSLLKELRDSSREQAKVQKDMSIRQIDDMVRGKKKNPLEALVHTSNDWLGRIYRKPGAKTAVPVTLQAAAALLKVDDAVLHADLIQARADLKLINTALVQNKTDLSALVKASTMSHTDLTALNRVVNDTNVTAKTHAEILRAIKDTQKAIKEQDYARFLELKAHRELLKAHKDTLAAIRLINHAMHSVHIAQLEVAKAIRDTHKAHVDLAKGQAALRKAMHETAKTHAQIAKKHHDIAAANRLIHNAHLEATKAHHETTKALHDTAKAHHETGKAHKAATLAHHETTKALKDQALAHHATTKALHDTMKAHHETVKALHDTAKDHRNIHAGHVQVHVGHAATAANHRDIHRIHVAVHGDHAKTAANHRDIHNYHVGLHGAHLTHAQQQTYLHAAHVGVSRESKYHHQMTHYFTHRGAGHLYHIASGASGGYAGGLPNVPTNMFAKLHAGETVLNPGEAQTYKATRSGTLGAGIGMGGIGSKKVEALLAEIHDTLKSTRPEIHVSTTATSPKVQTNVISKYARSK